MNWSSRSLFSWASSGPSKSLTVSVRTNSDIPVIFYSSHSPEIKHGVLFPYWYYEMTDVYSRFRIASLSHMDVCVSGDTTGEIWVKASCCNELKWVGLGNMVEQGMLRNLSLTTVNSSSSSSSSHDTWADVVAQWLTETLWLRSGNCLKSRGLHNHLIWKSGTFEDLQELCFPYL